MQKWSTDKVMYVKYSCKSDYVKYSCKSDLNDKFHIKNHIYIKKLQMSFSK